MCLPLKMSRCPNVLRVNVTLASVSGNVSVVPSKRSNVDSSNDHLDFPAHVTSGSDSISDSSYVSDTNHSCVNDDDSNNWRPVPAYIDNFMVKAYGGTLLFPGGGDRSSPWCQRWDAAVRLIGKHYALPGGSVGRHFVDPLSAELNDLGTGWLRRVIIFVIWWRNNLSCGMKRSLIV